MAGTLLAVFFGGMALNLTPCVYPLIPITISYFGGQSGQAGKKIWAHGLLYILGLSLTNSLLGVAAALTGGLMGGLLQNPWVLMGLSAVLIGFAASLFGFWELRLPSALTQLAAQSYTGYFGTFFMGLTLGVVAAPCIGPFVLGLLTWVAGLGSPWLGFIIFFTLSLGLGLPLFFLALFSGKIEKLPRSGEWMLWVRKLMGWVLIGMAVYFLRPLLPQSWGPVPLGLMVLMAGVHLGWLDRTKAGFRAFSWAKRGIGLAALVLASFLIGSFILSGPGVAWQPYSEELLAEGRRLKKPVILDFYAAWCAPCREMEEITFHNPAVVRKASKNFIMIKVDLTRGDNPLDEKLVSRYRIRGVPTIVFLDPEGKERKDLRLIDFTPPDRFLKTMEALW
jgi:thiol:disulfide interchange protein DsbD